MKSITDYELRITNFVLPNSQNELEIKYKKANAIPKQFLILNF